MAGVPYICLYPSYLETLEPFTDAEVGALIRAMLRYAEYGEIPHFQGNERFIWPSLKAQIDRDAEAYASKCAKNRASGAKGGRPPKKQQAKPETEGFPEKPNGLQENRTVNSETEGFFTKPKKPKEKEKEKEKEQEKEKDNIFISTAAVAAADINIAPAADAADNQLQMWGGALGQGVVALTDEQAADLLDRMGQEMFDHYVGKLSNFIIRKNAKVKNHYGTILKWWTEDSQTDRSG